MYFETDENCRLLQEKVSSLLAKRKKKAKGSGKGSTKRNTQQPLSMVTNYSALLVIQTNRSQPFLDRLSKRVQISTEEASIVCGKIPIISGAILSMARDVEEMIPLHITFTKLAKVLGNAQSLSLIIAKYDVEMESARMIDFGSTYDTITKQADKTETERANSIPAGSERSIAEATYKELTKVQVEMDPDLKKLNDYGKVDDFRKEIRCRVRECLKHRDDIDVLVSVLSKCCAADYLTRNVTISQVLLDSDQEDAWELYRKEMPEHLQAAKGNFLNLSICAFKKILRKALGATDNSIREIGVRLTIKICKDLRNWRRKEVHPALADAQNFRPLTGDIATPRENAGLFIDNNYNAGNASKSSSQTKQQCMATRIIMLLELCDILEHIFKANNIDTCSFKSTKEVLFYLPSDDLVGRRVGLFEKIETYKGYHDGSNNFLLSDDDVEDMKYLVTKATKKKLALDNFMAFLNLAGSQEDRQSTAQVYIDLLQHFCTGDGEEE